MIDLAKIKGFDSGEGNIRKNEKHGVSMAEAEQVFSMPRYWFWKILSTVHRRGDSMR
jgi:uncharacterized DUF497 family protein